MVHRHHKEHLYESHHPMYEDPYGFEEPHHYDMYSHAHHGYHHGSHSNYGLGHHGFYHEEKPYGHHLHYNQGDLYGRQQYYADHSPNDTGSSSNVGFNNQHGRWSMEEYPRYYGNRREQL